MMDYYASLRRKRPETVCVMLDAALHMLDTAFAYVRYGFPYIYGFFLRWIRIWYLLEQYFPGGVILLYTMLFGS